MTNVIVLADYRTQAESWVCRLKGYNNFPKYFGPFINMLKFIYREGVVIFNSFRPDTENGELHNRVTLT